MDGRTDGLTKNERCTNVEREGRRLGVTGRNRDKLYLFASVRVCRFVCVCVCVQWRMDAAARSRDVMVMMMRGGIFG